jgi:hypothetical protein
LANGKESIPFWILLRGKLNKKKNCYSNFSERNATDELDDILIAAKTGITNP